MRWLRFASHRLLPVVVVVTVTLTLRSVLSPWLAWTATVAIGALLAVLGALLLHTTRIGELTWKNRLSGHLLPWGHHLGGGRLPGIVMGSVVVWAALAAAVLLSAAPAAPVGATNQPAAVVAATSPWLLLTWIVEGALLLWMGGQMRRHYQPGSSATGSQWRTLLAVTTILVVSVFLQQLGRPGFALLVAGAPLLLVGGGYALFVGYILVFGRNTRWN